MNSGADYLLGQLLSLIFYIMTLIIYNRARKEYAGGKIADAINLIMIFSGNPPGCRFCRLFFAGFPIGRRRH